jgi:hypothetical protein
MVVPFDNIAIELELSLMRKEIAHAARWWVKDDAITLQKKFRHMYLFMNIVSSRAGGQKHALMPRTHLQG